jgi:diguanylate cyclase (GGDEF)-like protein
VLEINRNPADSNGQDKSFDWCHSVQAEPAGLKDRFLFVVGAVFLTVLLGWQIAALGHQLLVGGFSRERIIYSILNILVGTLVTIGMFLLHRSTSENRLLRRNLQLAEGLQEMQAELRTRNRELELQSRTDFLTGIGNRLLLAETLEIETQRCDRYGETLSVAVIEIGGLRSLRAQLGRQVVDETIRSRVTLLQQGIEASDWLFRLSDGEFLVMWLNTHSQSASAKAERLYNALLEKNKLEGLDVPVSAGVTTYVRKEGCDRLLARADLAKKALFKGGFRLLTAGEAELSPSA